MTDQPHIYIIGDSISLQYGPHLQAMLGDAFRYDRKSGEAEAMLNLDNPRGANGGDSSMVRKFLAGLADDPDFRVDLMLINCGLHDIKTDPDTGDRAVEPDAYRKNLHAIIDLTRSAADAFAWVTTTAVDDAMHAQRGCGFARVDADVKSYNAIADQVMREHGVRVIDLHDFTARLGTGSDVFRDGVHFVESVQKLQAAFIAGWLGRWRDARG